MQKKRWLKAIYLLLALITLSVMAFAGQAAEAADDYAWVLVETQYRRTGLTDYTSTPPGEWQSSNFYSEYLNHTERRIELKRTSQRGRTPSDPPMNMHVIYTWSAPPSVIRANGNISFSVNQNLLANVTGGYGAHMSWNAEAGYLWPLLISQPQDYAGERSLIFGTPSASVKTFQQSGTAVFTAGGWGAGREGNQRTITVYAGTGVSLGTREQYVYEWKKVSALAPSPLNRPQILPLI